MYQALGKENESSQGWTVIWSWLKMILDFDAHPQ